MFQIIRRFLRNRLLLMFRTTRWHVRVPISCGTTNSRYDLLDLRPSRSLTIPTLSDESPQRVGDPNRLRVLWFLRTKAIRDVVYEFHGFDMMKRLISC